MILANWFERKKSTNSYIISGINSILKEYGKKHSNCKIIGINESEKKIEIFLYQDAAKSSLPIELFVIFESFLFLEHNKISFEKMVITCYFQESDTVEGPINEKITILQSLFMELYSSIDSTKKNNKEITKILAQKWIEENYYYRHALVLSEQTEYIKSLLTPWRNILYTTDKKYSATYSYKRGTLSIDKWENFSGKTISQSNLENHADLFGAWGENYELWLLEDGLKISMFIINEIGVYYKEDNIDTSNIPYPLKCILEKQ